VGSAKSAMVEEHHKYARFGGHNGCHEKVLKVS
jgi:hypothetical protein